MKVRFLILIPVFLFLFLAGRTQNDLNDPLRTALPMSRRAALQEKLLPKSCAVIFSGGYQQFTDGGVIPRRFQVKPDFAYLTGLDIPDAVLVIFAQPQKTEEGEYRQILFVPDKKDYFLTYMGEAYSGKFGLQEGGVMLRPASEWRKFCIQTLASSDVTKVLSTPLLGPGYSKPGKLAYRDLGSLLHASLSPGFPFNPTAQGYYQEIAKVDTSKLEPLIARVSAYLNYTPAARRDPVLDGFTRLTDARDLADLQAQIGDIKLDLIQLPRLMGAMRTIKSREELQALRLCSVLLQEALETAASEIKAGTSEYAIAATGNYVLERKGAVAAMPLRVASGVRAALPYYQRNSENIPAEGLVVLDFAARKNGYVSRMSRTLPANGAFSATEKQIYSKVRGVHETALAACRPGATPSKVINAALPDMDGLITQLAIATNKSGKFKIVRAVSISPIGLDLNELTLPEVLATGMVFELETAIYVPYHSRINSKWRNTGIVFRDVIEITSDGAKVLTKGSGWSSEAMEALIR